MVSAYEIDVLLLYYRGKCISHFLLCLLQRPFALLTLGLIPFMGFGAAMEMKLYMADDKVATDKDKGRSSSGGIVVETLVNIRTVASLSIEETRSSEYADALSREDSKPLLKASLRGFAFGIGQFIQLWGKLYSADSSGSFIYFARVPN